MAETEQSNNTYTECHQLEPHQFPSMSTISIRLDSDDEDDVLEVPPDSQNVVQPELELTNAQFQFVYDYEYPKLGETPPVLPVHEYPLSQQSSNSGVFTDPAIVSVEVSELVTEESTVQLEMVPSMEIITPEVITFTVHRVCLVGVLIAN